ncbi:hypothetical protein J6W34_03115 [bacterium]|nr:hypothetical protein [bacterium]
MICKFDAANVCALAIIALYVVCCVKFVTSYSSGKFVVCKVVQVPLLFSFCQKQK